jgi:WD40 repeat protein
VVNVSVYKINCLGFVGDYLWAGYKTGMIYVYDTKTNPWTVKKDWRAHDSPVCGFVLDTSSVWTINRLQVTSLGTDNCIRIWDGMLEDDWLGMFLVTWFQFFIDLILSRHSNAKQRRGVLQISGNTRCCCYVECWRFNPW